jgi:hypothetical protein
MAANESVALAKRSSIRKNCSTSTHSAGLVIVQRSKPCNSLNYGPKEFRLRTLAVTRRSASFATRIIGNDRQLKWP